MVKIYNKYEKDMYVDFHYTIYLHYYLLSDPQNKYNLLKNLIKKHITTLYHEKIKGPKCSK